MFMLVLFLITHIWKLYFKQKVINQIIKSLTLYPYNKLSYILHLSVKLSLLVQKDVYDKVENVATKAKS